MITRFAGSGGWRRWPWILTLLLAAAIAAMVALLKPAARESTAGHQATKGAAATKAAPAAPQPIPEPLRVAALTQDQARASNLAMPFASDGATVAQPFVYVGDAADRAAAQACLAAAVYYEAGDDALGEEAVAQVVLNRLRHPAFPKTVCGVVFQGTERRTGCQFTFSCDGSLARVPPPAALARARDIAALALAGHVARAVGLSTYYHADWVVPYWRDELDKVAVVHTQIFYRWHGALGRPAAFRNPGPMAESVDPRIGAFIGQTAFAMPAMEEDDVAAPPLTSVAIAGVSRAALKGSIVRLKDEDAAQYILQLPRAAAANGFTATASSICAAKSDCIVLAWADEHDVPRSLPVAPLKMRTVAFVYHKSSILNDATSFWDCRRYPRPVKSQCLRGTR